MRTVTDNIPGMVGYWTGELRCGYANPAYREYFGKTQEEIRDIHLPDLYGEKFYKKNESFIKAVLRGEIQRFESSLAQKNGGNSYILCQYVPNMDRDRVLGFFVLIFDVTELKMTQIQLEKLVQKFKRLATTDHLTGISNRRMFFEQAGREFERSRRFGEHMSLLMMDIDHFKSINDSYGHDCGDDVLKTMAMTCKKILRSVDLFGRLGGEEFAILLINPGLDGGIKFAERLRQAIADLKVDSNDRIISFTVSIGIAPFIGENKTVENLLKQADIALYKAKTSGRNKICVSDTTT
ncbi:MAG: GGDEF domain-containing protein [Deltaproteobacteria bacterium]|nr:GGDEF domain-containing protein [Deltaproteobacteria bacterium]